MPTAGRWRPLLSASELCLPGKDAVPGDHLKARQLGSGQELDPEIPWAGPTVLSVSQLTAGVTPSWAR